MSLYVGVDLGGTAAKIAIVGGNKKIIKHTTLASDGLPSPKDLTGRIVETIRQLSDGRKFARLGVGVAGDIDFIRGVVRVSPNLGWTNVPLRALLQNQVRIPVVVDNDANAAAWGIFKTQTPPHVKNIIVATLGTGVGGGLIIDGQLHRGSTGSAGEIGHIILDESGPRCNCGLRGCLETYVGGPHLVRRVLRALSRGRRSRLQKLFRKNPKALTPKAISDAAHQGDSYARSVWNEVGHRLGIALGDLIYVFNPEMIYLTGGLSQAGPLILKPLRETLSRRPFQTPVRAAILRVAKEPAHIGVIGASLL